MNDHIHPLIIQPKYLHVYWLMDFGMMLIVLEISFCQVTCLRMCVRSCLLYSRWAVVLMQRLWIRKGNRAAPYLLYTYSEGKIWSGGGGRGLTLLLWASMGMLWFGSSLKLAAVSTWMDFSEMLPLPSQIPCDFLPRVRLTCATFNTLSLQYCSFLSSWIGRRIPSFCLFTCIHPQWLP